MSAKPLVFVSVGTDHHRFERLTDWVQRWLEHTARDVRCVVQHGTSSPPAGAEAYDLLPHDEMMRLLGEATVVVTQGGPGGILDAREVGRRPIVVPRRHDLGEHVDDHQLAFTARLAASGHIVRVDEEAAFVAALEAGLADPESLRVSLGSGNVPAVERFSAEVAAMLRLRRSAPN